MAAQHRDKPDPNPMKIANLPANLAPIPFRAEDIDDADLAKVVARVAAGGLPIVLTTITPPASFPEPPGPWVFSPSAVAVILGPADYLRLVLRSKADPESA